MFKSIKAFFKRLDKKALNADIDWEIFNRIFPHLEREKDHGYSFSTDGQMEAETEKLDARILLDAIERQIKTMPDSQGKAFRYILHRDLRDFLEHYESVAQDHGYPPYAPDWQPVL